MDAALLSLPPGRPPSPSTMISSASSANHHQQPNGTHLTPIHGAPHHHRHHHDEEEEEEEGDGGDAQEQEEEEEVVEEEAGDCFFESLDRVPSSVSFVHDLPTDSDDDEEDDVRVSFASAIAGPSDLQSITSARDERVVEHQEDRRDEVRSGYDYEVWMAEPQPTSINERRRRFLHGMGFSSNTDLTAAMRSRSRKAADTPAAAKESRTFAVPSLPKPVVARCRSVVDLTMTQRPPKPPATPSLPRATSAPPTLCDQLERQSCGATGSPETEGEQKGGDLVLPSGGILRIKNLDTGKEFLVSEVVKDGNWGLNDLETGTQISMDEFEEFLGYSPIVKELMRRASMGDSPEQGIKGKATPSLGSARRSKSGYRKKGSWFKNIKFVASTVTGRIAEKDVKGDLVSKTIGKSSCDCSSEVMKVRHHGKSYKDLTGLYMSQEIHAHKGSIWSIKFSWDGRYLASAGEDHIVRVWLVQESDIHSTPLRGQDARSIGSLRTDASPERFPLIASQLSKMSKKYKSRKRSVPDYIIMPEVIFSLSEKPICSFEGHLDDVLDLSWSKSQLLLSSSMDKTVRLWDMESKACLKLFAHNDYVTCIQFNPMDDRYFISGSLDAKVRIWSIPEHQVVDWSDLHEMVTAACYTPDGQGALVGSHKGNFRRYKTSACKLSQESQIEIKKKKANHAKKITGFQFAPGSPSEVLITSADSRVRVFDGLKLVHKFRGFRNTSSQISASYTYDGKYVICASEDSHVYVWKREAAQVVSSGGQNKGWTTTRSHEYFHCKDVSVAIPWPTAGSNCSPLSLPPSSGRFNLQESIGHTDSQRSTTSLEDIFHSNRSHYPPLPKKSISEKSASEEFRNLSYSGSGIGSESFASSSNSLRCGPVPSSLSESSALGSFTARRWYNGSNFRTSSTDQSNAWGLVVVTAGLDGNIRIYQNFGLPLRLRQTILKDRI